MFVVVAPLVAPVEVLSTAALPLPLAPLAARGDWLRVAPGHLADRIAPSGWIRWRAPSATGGRLLVSYAPAE
jgi:hypothetical protein